MRIKTNKVGRKYGEFFVEEEKFDDKENSKWVKRKIEVVRWYDGALTISTGKDVLVIPCKEVKAIAKLPKVR